MYSTSLMLSGVYTELLFASPRDLINHMRPEQGHPVTPVEHRHTDHFLMIRHACDRLRGGDDEEDKASVPALRQEAGAGDGRREPHRLAAWAPQRPLSGSICCSAGQEGVQGRRLRCRGRPS